MEKREAPGYPGKGRRIRQWSSIAIVMLIAGIVVGSWTVISRMANKQPVTGGKNVATPQNTNKYVYIGYKDVVYKLSERDGSIVWQHALKQPHKPYRLIGSSLQVRVENDVVYATVEYAVYALSSSNGKELWHYFPTPTKEQLQRGIGSVMDLFIDRSLVYVSSPDGGIAALDAHSGIQKWRRILLPNGGPISAVDGMFYLQESGPQGNHILHAIDGATGVERWRFESPIWGNAGFTPASVVNGIVYSSGNPLTALDERTGKKLWEQRLPDRSMYFDNFHIINGILYSSTSAPSILVGGQEEPLDHYLVFAFDAKTGKQLWQSPPGYQFLDVAGNSVLLQTVGITKEYSVQAVNAQSGTQSWKITLIVSPCNAGEFCFSPQVYIVEQQLYVLDGKQPRTLQVFDLRNGKRLAQRPISLPEKEGIGPGVPDNGTLYIRTQVHEGGAYVSGSSNTFWHYVIYAIRFTDGSVIWKYEIGSLREYQEPISQMLVAS